MGLQSALDGFRYVTVVVTLAVMVFCIWITDGATVGRILAGGVLAFGTVQFLVLTKFSRREAARLADMQSEQENFESESSSE